MDEQAKKDFRIDFTPAIFRNHIEPEGLLPASHALESSAAWYFIKCAHQSLDVLESQVAYEGDSDITVSLRSLANNVRVMYGIATLEEMMRFIPAVKAEAERVGLFWNPKLDIWYASGGQKLDEVTRDPDKLNISGG